MLAAKGVRIHMNWVKKSENHYSAPYQILSGVRGWSVFVYSTKASGCLGREIPNLDAAKFICEAHKTKEAQKAMLAIAKDLHA